MGAATIMVTVGTDHHPFDRLVRWVDAWLAGRDPDRVECHVQSGRSQPSVLATCRPYLPAPELSALIARSAAVVCHAGPATIMQSRAAGVIPLVVPRDPRHGEHVDDHQLRFARFLGEAGHVLHVTSAAELARHLDRAVEDPTVFRLPRTVHTSVAAAERVSVLARDLLSGRGRPRVRGAAVR